MKKIGSTWPDRAAAYQEAELTDVSGFIRTRYQNPGPGSKSAVLLRFPEVCAFSPKYVGEGALESSKSPEFRLCLYMRKKILKMMGNNALSWDACSKWK